MKELLEKHLKYLLGIGIIIFFVSTFIFKDNTFLDNFDNAITLTLIIWGFYAELGWKLNPFSKIPKIYGEYEMSFFSSYDNLKRKMNIIVKQDLYSSRIYMKTKESYSESLTADLLKKDDYCELVYTYQNEPNAIERNHSEIHFGTCIFKIVDRKIINGKYYTDRKTIGDITNIKKLTK